MWELPMRCCAPGGHGDAGDNHRAHFVRPQIAGEKGAVEGAGTLLDIIRLHRWRHILGLRGYRRAEMQAVELAWHWFEWQSSTGTSRRCRDYPCICRETRRRGVREKARSRRMRQTDEAKTQSVQRHVSGRSLTLIRRRSVCQPVRPDHRRNNDAPGGH